MAVVLLLSSNSGVGSYRPVIFTYNKLYECGVYDGRIPHTRQYEHNDIVSSVNLQTFEYSDVRSSSVILRLTSRLRLIQHV